MKAVEVTFSLKLLKEFLRLPGDVQFTKVTQNYQQLRDGSFSLIVESENLPPILTRHSIPWGSIVLHTEWCNVEERTHLVRGEVIAR